jgi:hypothetical protein
MCVRLYLLSDKKSVPGFPFLRFVVASRPGLPVSPVLFGVLLGSLLVILCWGMRSLDAALPC